jgi:lipid-A-disaccharide synthase
MSSSSNPHLKKLFIMSGEASGDLHGAGVVRELKRQNPELDIFGVGGTHIEAAGARLLYQVEQINFMGFVEVAKHYPFLRKVLQNLKDAIVREKPDAALLIDYPGMNLILAEFLHHEKIPVVYYIAPQVWAWKEGRAKKIKAFVSRLCVVFDFEVGFFQKHGINAEFVGHPILEELEHSPLPTREEFLNRLNLPANTRFVGLLPGSRPQEVERIFPAMLGAAEKLHASFPSQNLRFLLGKAPTISDAQYQKFLSASSVVPHGVSAYEVMQFSELGFVTSGTATLESLSFGMPMVVCYKTSPLNYHIGKRLVKIEKIALANIIAEGLYGTAKVVPELLQHDLTSENLAHVAHDLLENPAKRGDMQRKLIASREKLGSLKPSHEVSRIVQEILQ